MQWSFGAASWWACEAFSLVARGCATGILPGRRHWMVCWRWKAGGRQMLKIALREARRCKKGPSGDGERAEWLTVGGCYVKWHERLCCLLLLCYSLEEKLARTFLLMKHHTNGHGCRVGAIDFIEEMVKNARWATLADGSMTELLKMEGRRQGSRISL